MTKYTQQRAQEQRRRVEAENDRVRSAKLPLRAAFEHVDEAQATLRDTLHRHPDEHPPAVAFVVAELRAALTILEGASA